MDPMVALIIVLIFIGIAIGFTNGFFGVHNSRKI